MSIGNLGSTTCNARRYAISPDWTMLAAPQDGGSVVMYDLATGRPAPSLEGGFKVGIFTYVYTEGVPPCEFGFNTDGRFVIWSWGKKFVAWEVATQRIVLKREGAKLMQGKAPESGAELLIASPYPEAGNATPSREGWFNAIVNADGDVEVYRRPPAEATSSLVLPMRVKGNRGRCVFFDNDAVRSGSQLLLSYDGQLLVDSCQVTDVWDLRQPIPRLVTRTGRLRQEAGRPVLSRDGRTIAYSWGDGSPLAGDGGFGLLDVASASRVGPQIEVKYLGAMGFSPDGTRLATVGWVPRSGSKRTYEVQIWNVDAIRSGVGAKH